MKKKRNITLKDIAKELNLSVSTVSRALNNHPDISEITKVQVQALAKQYNYVPNLFAKGFRTKHTHIIGVVVPNISHFFTTTILKGILEQGEKMGYQVIVAESQNDVNKQLAMLNTMIQFGVDGILLSMARRTYDVSSIIKIKQRVPLVLFDKVSNKVPCTQVVIDEVDAAYGAVEHLINIGKKRIAIIKETENSYNSEMRFRGYQKALEDHNLEVDPKLIVSTEDISLDKGRIMASALLTLRNKPDAIFAITDAAAIGAIKALKKYNVKIPEDIAVIGFSNSEHATIISPALTTVDQPGNLIGSTAITYLINEIEKEEESFLKTVEVKTHLIIRDSTFTTVK
ncbi:LacI family DNA-binding transcriptional regulator [Flavobacterium sp. ASW18X]|uniref:LacI family DNA-binding transcriptional regulator n=1 Tax=Flavobacterium sp. ASW18X TaxID=2572595 RepID=UPI0010AEBE6C|nr:LacI family DNA-binding transcriptional regulator [Flavobacterium sp. ASW18X]TKD63616.1 LacI family transcriptional regulator [Flavobacterium sp. ASW18X]